MKEFRDKVASLLRRVGKTNIDGHTFLTQTLIGDDLVVSVTSKKYLEKHGIDVSKILPNVANMDENIPALEYEAETTYGKEGE